MSTDLHKTLMLLCALLLSRGLYAAGAAPPQSGAPQDWRYSTPVPPPSPKWSVQLKTGTFNADLDDWDRYYDDDDMFAAVLGYNVLRIVEVGLEMGQVKTSGVGQLPIAGGTGGLVDYRLRPTHLYITLRGLFSEDQWAVPYIGGGATRVFYRQSVAFQSTREGEVDGSHWRAGVQFLLDRADESLAAEGDRQLGINNTYLVVEKQSFSAEIEGIDLGGEVTFIGLLVEF